MNAIQSAVLNHLRSVDKPVPVDSIVRGVMQYGLSVNRAAVDHTIATLEGEIVVSFGEPDETSAVDRPPKVRLYARRTGT